MAFSVVLAGCGQMAHTWVEYTKTREDIQIVGLVDIVSENAERLKSRYQLSATIFPDLAAALRSAHPDVVFDVASPESRRTLVETALTAGCHVFSEKPMATSLDDARALVRLAKQTGKIYAVMQNRRYHPQIRALTDLVQGGRIGTPGWATADFFLGPHFGGFRDLMDHPLLLDMAIHTFDQARLILGQDPVAVYCHEFNPPGSWYRGNAAAAAIFEFADGTVFTYQGAWCAQGAPTSWEANWRIVGSRGTALWDGSNPPYAEVIVPDASGFQRPTTRVEAALTWRGQSGHFGCLDAMFAALADGGPPETAAEDNIHSMVMVFGAIASAARHERVTLSP